jgi:hypothetical protein
MARRRDPRWVRVTVVVLVFAAAGWMVHDGAKALVTGDYVTAAGGRLGPWASLVESIGIDPRGTPMKSFFVAYGVAWLIGLVGYLRDARWGRAALVAGAAGSLWYLVAGTVSSVVQLALLAAGSRARRAEPGPSARSGRLARRLARSERSDSAAATDRSDVSRPRPGA